MQPVASPSLSPRALIGRLAWIAVPIGLFMLTFAAYGAINQDDFAHNNYFVPLADAFLHGRLDLAEHPSWLNELVPFQGKYYVVYPPMPAIVLMPFVWRWGAEMNQADVSAVFGALNVFFVYFLCMHWGFGMAKRLLFSLLFGFGTITWYSAQVGSSWHFAQVVAISFLLAALVEVYQERRAWVLGLLLGCAALSRLPVLMAFPFFLAMLAEGAGPAQASSLRAWWQGLDRAKLLKSTLTFGATLALPLASYLLYNHARFGSPFITGYTMIPGLLQEYQYRFGFFSLESIGRNLYAMWLQMPRYMDQFPYIQPARLGGLSLLFTTPLFAWAIKARRWDWFHLGAWSAVLLTAVPILLHADTGGEEFGYRYAQDFYPILFLLMLRGMGPKLTFEQKIALLLGFLVNAWGIWVKLNHGWA